MLSVAVSIEKKPSRQLESTFVMEPESLVLHSPGSISGSYPEPDISILLPRILFFNKLV
jgi:hypothetical protein